MRIEVTVPNLPESVSDATLLDWHKKPGEAVKRNENLIDLETDKVVLEVPVPEDGVLAEVLHDKGDTVKSGEALAIIDTETAATPTKAPAPQDQDKAVPKPPKPAPADAGAETAARTEKEPEPRDTAVPEPPKSTGAEPAPALSPSVRRLVTGHAVDPASIKGTGRDGRLTKEDVLSYLKNPAQPAPVAPETPETIEEAAAVPVAPPAREAQDRREQRVPMTRLRARIAERLLQVQQTTASLTTFNEVNLSKIIDLRNRYKETFEREHKIKLGFMPFFVKAVVESLKRFPIINATLDGQEIVYHGYYDIGIAVSSDRGLVVPILRDADRLDFAAIDRAIADFAKKARDGKLSYDELNGGTFTITNGGIFGSLLSTPILNPPQSAILGMHAIKERPVVENGEIVVRPMIYLALSYDHRLIDGRDAVQFLVMVKDVLEDPARLILNV
jgi:2-oxoglutarate dehydrogenase E2 component (dihydrolipoamide succinyltransferase)